MLDDGLFDRFPCDAIYGIHNSPDMPLGTVKGRMRLGLEKIRGEMAEGLA